MSRRKKHTILAKDLQIYEKLIDELSQNPELADYDMSTIEISILKTYTPQIVNVDKAILHLKRYMAANKRYIKTYEDEQFINRIELAKMLGITRQTLTSWIDKGFITPSNSKYLRNTETFNTDAVLAELLTYKSENPDK